MSKDAVGEWSTTAADNSDIGGINIAQGTMAVSDTDNAFREMMRQLAVAHAARWTDPAITGAIKEDIFTITDGAAFEIDPGNGTIQRVTLGANRTPKATNFENGESVLLLVDDGTSRTLTWTDATFGGAGVAWRDATLAPTLDPTNLTAIVLWKYNGRVYGVAAGVFAA